MTQTIDRKEFLDLLTKVSIGIAQKEMIEQSASFIFTSKKGHNSVHAFNNEIFATINTNVKLNAAVEAQPLLDVLKKIKSKTVDIWTEDDELRIEAKGSDNGIKMDKKIALAIDDINIPEKFTKVQENFSDLCRLACLTAGHTMDEPLLLNVNLSSKEIQSCDNDRITICKLDKSMKLTALIPATNLKKIVTNKIIGIYKENAWIHFKAEGGLILSTGILEEDFIDVNKFIPDEDGEKLTLPNEIGSILDRANIFSKDTISNERVVHIHLTSQKKGLLVISSRNESGWSNNDARTKYKGPDLNFMINADFLKDILQITNTIHIVDDVILFQDEATLHMVKLEGEEEEE